MNNQPPDLEVCQRSMDFWTIYTNTKKGTIKMTKYHAQIKGDGGYWSCGHTIEEAISDLVNSHPEKFENGYGNVFYMGTLGR